jgi:protein phosphatase
MSSLEVDLAALSDKGKKRPSNEDHFLVMRFQRSLKMLSSNLPEGTLPDEHIDTAHGYLVADGMGGAAAGEVASRTAIRALIDLAIRTPDWIMRWDDGGAEQILERMRQRFLKLTEVLSDLAENDPKLAGMGTTMTVALSLEDNLIITHIGDSRAYLYRNGELHRRTHDQTVAQSLVDSGALKPEDIKRHPMRHMLTAAITTKRDKAPAELLHLQLEDGDQVLLCSDGLTDMVPDEGIAEILAGPGSAESACRALVDRALEAGGKDNVTVALGRYRRV